MKARYVGARRCRLQRLAVCVRRARVVGIIYFYVFLSDWVGRLVLFRIIRFVIKYIMSALMAHADPFIERLPKKYETLLGECGTGLSQRQRQLISIARAALANPRVLIPDEATASVDTRPERLIQQALEKLLKGRTSFVIAHRLSTVRNADQVLVLKDGEIAERGKHDELLAQEGVCDSLYMSQFRREEPPAVIPALAIGPASGLQNQTRRIAHFLRVWSILAWTAPRK